MAPPITHSPQASTTPPAARTSFFQSWTFSLTIIGIAVLIALLYGYLQTTVVTGAEFDTGSWTIRTFWYRRDPFSGRQLTGILREQPTSISTSPAFPNSYFSGANSKPPRWDLVKLSCGTTMTEGPAYVLNSYLDGYDAERLWPTWSSENPVKAKTLWSAARDLVDLGLYHKLPKIMELAKVDSTDAEFTTMINEEMNAILSAHAEKLRVGENSDELTVTETVLNKYATSKSNTFEF
jgi:hypothetical protein